MPITSISRDWGVDPQIVRMVTTDTIGQIATTGYWLTQASALLAINRGDFEWADTDVVLIAYNGGKGFFVFDAATNSFLPDGQGFAQIRVTSAQILAMSASPVVIVPNPGPNKLVVVGRNTYTYLFNTVQYAAGGVIGLQFGTTALLAGAAASTTLAAATFNAYAASNNFELTPDNTDTLANTVGRAITLSNQTAAFTTGNGSLLVNIEYNIVKTT